MIEAVNSTENDKEVKYRALGVLSARLRKHNYFRTCLTVLWTDFIVCDQSEI